MLRSPSAAMIENRPHLRVDGRDRGRVNPRPRVTVTKDGASARLYDGDGGLGHIVCVEATRWAIETAKRSGSATAVTRNHFHFGAAGFYSRMAAREGCIAIALSSSRGAPVSGTPLHAGVVGPVSISVPSMSDALPDFMLDGDMPRGGTWTEVDDEEAATSSLTLGKYIAQKAKRLGLDAFVHIFGGVLPGIYLDDVQPPDASQWEANQGSFIAVFDPSFFMESDVFAAEMKRYTLRRSSRWSRGRARNGRSSRVDRRRGRRRSVQGKEYRWHLTTWKD